MKSLSLTISITFLHPLFERKFIVSLFSFLKMSKKCKLLLLKKLRTFLYELIGFVLISKKRRLGSHLGLLRRFRFPFFK